jgi:hypothetical protein
MSGNVTVPAFRYGDSVIREATYEGGLTFPEKGFSMNIRHPSAGQHDTSFTLNWTRASPHVLATLYEVGRDLYFRRGDLSGLAREVIDLGAKFYADAQGRKNRALMHFDFLEVLVKGLPEGLDVPNPEEFKDYRFCRYHRDVEHLEEAEDAVQIQRNQGTESFNLWLPPAEEGRFIVPSGSRTYHKDAGTPLKTVASREAAVKAWEAMGLRKDDAENQVSMLFFDEAKNARGYIPLTLSSEAYGPLSLNFCSLGTIDFIQLEG